MSEARPEQVDEARIARGVAIRPPDRHRRGDAAGYPMGPRRGSWCSRRAAPSGSSRSSGLRSASFRRRAPAARSRGARHARSGQRPALRAGRRCPPRAEKDLENERPSASSRPTTSSRSRAVPRRAEDGAHEDRRGARPDAGARGGGGAGGYLEKAEASGRRKAEESEPDVTDESERPNDRVRRVRSAARRTSPTREVLQGKCRDQAGRRDGERGFRYVSWPLMTPARPGPDDPACVRAARRARRKTALPPGANPAANPHKPTGAAAGGDAAASGRHGPSTRPRSRMAS